MPWLVADSFRQKFLGFFFFYVWIKDLWNLVSIFFSINWDTVAILWLLSKLITANTNSRIFVICMNACPLSPLILKWRNKTTFVRATRNSWSPSKTLHSQAPLQISRFTVSISRLAVVFLVNPPCNFFLRFVASLRKLSVGGNHAFQLTVCCLKLRLSGRSSYNKTLNNKALFPLSLQK